MVIYKLLNNENLIKSVKNGDIGVIPTDTIYGISCDAFSRKSIERIYKVKGRQTEKPVIILISDISELTNFDVELDKQKKTILEANWPGPVSFVLPITKKYYYLSAGLPGLAFRLPKKRDLVTFISKTGPLVSTSANISGEEAVTNIDGALNVFEDDLDFYVDAGELVSEPSTLVDLTGTEPKVLRQGKYQLVLETTK